MGQRLLSVAGDGWLPSVGGGRWLLSGSRRPSAGFRQPAPAAEGRGWEL